MNTPSPAAIKRAGQILATARRNAAQMDPHTLAEQAWTPSCGMTVDELEADICRRRGIPEAQAS